MYPWVENDLGGRIWALSVISVLFEGFTLPEQVNSAHNMQNEDEIDATAWFTETVVLMNPFKVLLSKNVLECDYSDTVNKNENKENMQIPIFLVKCWLSLGMD